MCILIILISLKIWIPGLYFLGIWNVRYWELVDLEFSECDNYSVGCRWRSDRIIIILVGTFIQLKADFPPVYQFRYFKNFIPKNVISFFSWYNCIKIAFTFVLFTFFPFVVIYQFLEKIVFLKHLHQSVIVIVIFIHRRNTGYSLFEIYLSTGGISLNSVCHSCRWWRYSVCLIMSLLSWCESLLRL